MRDHPRINLIHATPLAVEPIAGSFAHWWPQARVYNLLDDSLTADLKAAGGNIEALALRFATLARYASTTGADAILFTCSAFGPAIEAAREQVAVPVLKPNEAMIDEALNLGRRIALVATFEPSLAPIAEEFRRAAAAADVESRLSHHFVAGAWEALQNGDRATHDRLIAETCAQAGDCDLVCFTQFSMTSAVAAAQQASGKPTLTTPDSAVKKLRALLT